MVWNSKDIRWFAGVVAAAGGCAFLVWMSSTPDGSIPVSQLSAPRTAELDHAIRSANQAADAT